MLENLHIIRKVKDNTKVTCVIRLCSVLCRRMTHGMLVPALANWNIL